MRRIAICLTTLMFTYPAVAASPNLKQIVDTHIIPGYQTLDTETADLAAAAAADCDPSGQTLLAAFHDAFDAWIAVSHLRFGPSERDDRAFALSFWPDPRGTTPKTLGRLIRDTDPVIASPKDFATVSVAARGFYALEMLLFDPALREAGAADYRCTLIRAIARDIHQNSHAILVGWTDGYADLLAVPGNDTYRSETEATRQVFTALSTGLEFTSVTRLGRPLGTFDRPRPTRAEARRSGRSLRHVILSLGSLRELALLLSGENDAIRALFDDSLTRADALNDPVFASVSDPQRRFQVEVLQQTIDRTRKLLAEEIGTRLGIASGFNALDGD